MSHKLLDKLRSSLHYRNGVLGKDKYFNSAVLIPIVSVDDELYFLFEKRARGIRQGGEVSFPGGEFDCKKDSDFLGTALRETFEEIGVRAENVEILGQMDTLVAPMGVTVDPFVGYIRDFDVTDLIIDKSEVEKVFTIPLSYFLNNNPTKYFLRLEVNTIQENKDGTIKELLPVSELNLPPHYSTPWRGRKHRVLVYRDTEEILWGITAEIVYELCRYLQKK